MFHLVEDYCEPVADRVMRGKELGGLICLPTIWCFLTFDIFMAAHVLNFMVTSKSEIKGVCVEHYKFSIWY